MSVDVADAPAPSRRPRVLVAATAPASATLRTAGAGDDPDFTFVGSADEAIEAALSSDFELVLLDLGLSGIGAEAAADILRRAGATCAIAAIGTPALATLFEQCVPAPLSTEAVQRLLRATAAPVTSSFLLDEGWIQRECADLAAEFGASLPSAAARLRATSEAGDIASLAAQVHALKGCAGAYGFHEVALQCVIVESGLRAGSHEASAVAALVDALVAASST